MSRENNYFPSMLVVGLIINACFVGQCIGTSLRDSPLETKCMQLCNGWTILSSDYNPGTHICSCDDGSAYVLGSTARRVLPARAQSGGGQ